MLALNLPPYSFKISNKEGKKYIFDVLRKKYVALTPEEWVRQHFTNYLLMHKGYPSGLLANEIQINLNGTKKRCDTVLYNRDLTAKMIVEYKAPDVVITQLCRSDNALQHGASVEYLIVTNGINHYCCRIDYATNSYVFLPEIPDYASL